MTLNQEEELLTLVKDNNILLKNIWTLISNGSPNDDLKDFLINVIANKVSNGQNSN